LKRTDIYVAISDVGLVLIFISGILTHFASEKELASASLAIGVSLGVGGLMTWALFKICFFFWDKIETKVKE
jgi:ABC-type cobalamin transport system permease subunit